MADTCIVCLGDLASSDPASSLLRSEDDDPLAANHAAAVPAAEDDTVIAHLLPCKHNLHNTCLKPWVERANSCPICRTDFNTVELRATLDGPCLDSYAVQDKKQTAEFDFSELIPPLDFYSVVDDEDDNDVVRGDCMVCEQGNDTEDLLLCDGCSATCHTHCCGLAAIPVGLWFCEFCHEDGTANAQRQREARRLGNPLRRNQSQARSTRRNAQARQSDYTRIWQTVLARTNIDLDFPFEDDAASSTDSATHAREMREWTRRFQIAERQGGAARFRETAGTILQARNQDAPPASPRPSREETQAWNAFEVARESHTEPPAASSSRRAKRKSRTGSPAEPEQSSGQERPLKRPRTRRVQRGPSSTAANASTTSSEAGPNSPIIASEPIVQGPSFLRQLLTEVQNSSAPVDRGRRFANPLSIHTPGTDGSPQPPSPTLSPPASDHPSPRLRSASPHSPFSSRPSSPSPGLTSRIEPIYAQRNVSIFSPVSPNVSTHGDLSPITTNGNERMSRQRCHSQQVANSDDDTRKVKRQETQRSPDQSPNRSTALSYEDKTRVQKMVSLALKPSYHKNEIDTDQYTEINKAISRKMYDRIALEGGLQSAQPGTDWQRIAASEVDAAIKARRDCTEVVSEAS